MIRAPLLFNFLSLFPLTHCSKWLEFGLNKEKRPVMQRKRVLGMEYVQTVPSDERKLVNSRLLNE